MDYLKAKRSSLSEANITKSDGQSLSVIGWPKVKIWSCENSALGDPYYQNPTLGSYPKLIIDGTEFIARRKLVTNHFFGNNYEISLWDKSGQIKISARVPGVIWKKTEIKYSGQSYLLFRKNLFLFHFILRSSEREICRFTDSTPFFTFSSRKDFLISSENLIDPVLLSFSFFLAHNEFFKIQKLIRLEAKGL